MKKDQSGYFRLDLKPSGKDYKSYLEEQAQKQGISVTKYIHQLIEKDMETAEQVQKRRDELLAHFSELKPESQEALLDVMELLQRI